MQNETLSIRRMSVFTKRKLNIVKTERYRVQWNPFRTAIVVQIWNVNFILTATVNQEKILHCTLPLWKICQIFLPGENISPLWYCSLHYVCKMSSSNSYIWGCLYLPPHSLWPYPCLFNWETQTTNQVPAAILVVGLRGCWLTNLF